MSELFGSWVAGGNPKKGRVKNDFYATPRDCTIALLNNIIVPDIVWEPACGDGAISNVLIEQGKTVISTDLNDYSYGISGVDFLLSEKRADAIITNPPFNLSELFIRKCQFLDIGFVAFLLKTQYWHAAKRMEIFNSYPPSKILAMTWRPDFSGGGSPTMDCMWCIWERGSKTTQYIPIGRKLK